MASVAEVNCGGASSRVTALFPSAPGSNLTIFLVSDEVYLSIYRWGIFLLFYREKITNIQSPTLLALSIVKYGASKCEK